MTHSEHCPKKKKSWLPALTILAILALLILLVPAMLNRFHTGYDTLHTTDQAVLRELDTYLAAERKAPAWNGFTLTDKAILASNKETKQAFLVNPTKPVHSLFAAKLALPQNFSIEAYRVSLTAPQMLQFILPSNFNSIGQTCQVLGSDVYYLKYDDKAITDLQSSGHFITLLTHEAFHYYMQNDWPHGLRFSAEELTDQDLLLMDNEYAVLAKIYDELQKAAPERTALLALAGEYCDSVQARIDAKPAYMEEELNTETAEGTATYIGVHASEEVGYSFKIMHFDGSSAGLGVIEWHFDEIVSMLRDGSLKSAAIAGDLVYQSGALLCELLDALEVPDWQQTLNAQTERSPVTLYQLISDYLKVNA